MAWEYHTLGVSDWELLGDRHAREMELLGVAGWELISTLLRVDQVVPQEDGGSHRSMQYAFVFKRPSQPAL